MRERQLKNWAFTALTVSTAYFVPGAPITAAQAQTVGIEELVVTARRREERLIDVPEAITAVTSADIEKQNFTDLKDISKLVPSLQVNTQGQSNARNRQSLLMRGIARGGTGIFINGTPTGSGVFGAQGCGGAPILGDLERIEILKGPQSAYFGRSTFAGAVNYVTKTPSDTWHGSA